MSILLRHLQTSSYIRNLSTNVYDIPVTSASMQLLCFRISRDINNLNIKMYDTLATNANTLLRQLQILIVIICGRIEFMTGLYIDCNSKIK